jgi:hypothetical protein
MTVQYSFLNLSNSLANVQYIPSNPSNDEHLLAYLNGGILIGRQIAIEKWSPFFCIRQVPIHFTRFYKFLDITPYLFMNEFKAYIFFIKNTTHMIQGTQKIRMQVNLTSHWV